jgi:hypothetical protein
MGIFEVIGFSEAAPGTGTVNLAAGLADQIYDEVGDYVRIKPGINNLIGVFYAAETTGGYALIRQASLKTDHAFIRSTDLNDLDAMKGLTWMGARPLPLKGGENVQALSNNATDEDTIVGLFLASDARMFDESTLNAVLPTHRIRGIGDTTITANQWSNVPITWDQTLPVGLYHPVGMKVAAYLSTYGAGLARLITQNGAQFRPGVVVEGSVGDKVQYDAGSQVLPCSRWPILDSINFNESFMPNIEVLSPIADTDFVVELELVGPSHWE